MVKGLKKKGNKKRIGGETTRNKLVPARTQYLQTLEIASPRVVTGQGSQWPPVGAVFSGALSARTRHSGVGVV